MGKSLFIAEKPSVAQEFAKALKINTKKHDGYLEGETAVITWCVGHLVKTERCAGICKSIKNKYKKT